MASTKHPRGSLGPGETRRERQPIVYAWTVGETKSIGRGVFLGLHVAERMLDAHICVRLPGVWRVGLVDDAYTLSAGL